MCNVLIGDNFEKIFEIESFYQSIVLSSTRICCAFDKKIRGGLKIIEYVTYQDYVFLYERKYFVVLF